MKHLALIIALFLPVIAAAQSGTYQPLVTLPGVATGDFDAYINSVYALSISIAALLAVIKIVVAGVKWMTTDVVTSKGDAKRDIQGALVGLLIVLSAVLIITVINPQITNVNFSLNTVSAPPAVLSTPSALATCPYSASSATTYSHIPMDSPACEQNQFISDCSSPDVIIRDIQTNQLRCTTISAADTAALNSYLSGLSGPEITTYTTLYQNYINNWSITSASTLGTIQADLGVTQIYYAVDLTGYPPANTSQFDGVCGAIARANGDDQQANIQTVYDYSAGNNYAACVRIN